MRTKRYEIGIASVAVFVGLDLALIAACLFALRANRVLQGVAATEEGLLAPIRGATAPPLTGKNWTGSLQTIAFGQDARPTLVYTFTRECPECAQNWLALRSVQMLAPDRLRLVHVDVPDKLDPSYLAANRIERSQMLVGLSSGAIFAYGARMVPQCELLDPDGRIVWTHVGPLTASVVGDLISTIGKNNRN